MDENAKGARGTAERGAAPYCRSEEKTALHELLGKIGEKWSVLLIVALARSPGKRARFSELRKRVVGVSQRMLTTTLRDLERDGFVTREVFAEVPPRVEYELTDLGHGILAPLEHVVEWSIRNREEIERARERFDAAKARGR